MKYLLKVAEQNQEPGLSKAQSCPDVTLSVLKISESINQDVIALPAF